MTDVNNLTGQMTIVDLSGITIWNGKREVNDPALKERIKRARSSVSIKAEFPQDKLRVFSTIKQRIRRCLEDEGYSFLSGFAVPIDRTESVMGRIRMHLEEAQAAKEAFLEKYDEYRDEALSDADDEHWRNILDEAMLSKDQVEARIAFDVAPMQISVSQYDPSAMGRRLQGLREQIIGQSIKIAQEWLDTNHNPQGLRKKSCADLKVLRKKIQGFKFLSGVDGKAIGSILDHALSAVEMCPAHTLPESVYWQVAGPISIIADEARLQHYLDGKITLDEVSTSPVQSAMEEGRFNVEVASEESAHDGNLNFDFDLESNEEESHVRQFELDADVGDDDEEVVFTFEVA